MNVKFCHVTCASEEIISGPIKLYLFKACRRNSLQENGQQSMSFRSGTWRFSRHVLWTVTCHVSRRLVVLHRCHDFTYLKNLPNRKSAPCSKRHPHRLAICERLLSFTRMMWVDLMLKWLLSLCFSSRPFQRWTVVLLAVCFFFFWKRIFHFFVRIAANLCLPLACTTFASPLCWVMQKLMVFCSVYQRVPFTALALSYELLNTKTQ